MKTYLSKLLTLVLILGMAACQNSGEAGASKAETEAASAKGNLLAPQAFKEKMNELTNETVLDLRTHSELHGTGPIAGAKNVDFNAGILERLIPSLDKSQPLMLYCASGGRSAEATKKLTEAGFTAIYDLEGGINAWKAAGFEVSAHHH